MSIPLNIQTLCDRGFADADSLNPQERLVFLLADLETLIDMEGWDYFFASDRLRYYPDLISGLQTAGDLVSVEILHDYENHFSRYGVAFEPSAISKFLFEEEPQGYRRSCRDWQMEFERAKETRWNKVEEYLSRHGYKIL